MKQINLLSSSFISLLKYALVAVLAILIFNWFKGCSSEPDKPKTQTVIIPEIKGKFEPKKPQSKPIEIIQKPINEVKKDGTVYVTNQLNEKLLQENEKLKAGYAKMSDSLKSKAYDKAIELNSFSSRFEDENLLIDINGIVRGEVQEITPSYTIKPRKVEITPKQTVFRLLVGVKLKSGIISPNLNIESNLMIQNKRGDIISAGYSNKNLNELNKDIWSVGYYKSIFNIKK